MDQDNPTTPPAEGSRTGECRAALSTATPSRGMASLRGTAWTVLLGVGRLVLVSPAVCVFLVLAFGLFQGGWDILQACGRLPFSSLDPVFPYLCRPLAVVFMHFSAGVLCVVESYLLFTRYVRQRHTNLLSPKMLGMVGLCLVLAVLT